MLWAAFSNHVEQHDGRAFCAMGVIADVLASYVHGFGDPGIPGRKWLATPLCLFLDECSEA
jgi:hypothetical protein